VRTARAAWSRGLFERRREEPEALRLVLWSNGFPHEWGSFPANVIASPFFQWVELAVDPQVEPAVENVRDFDVDREPVGLVPAATAGLETEYAGAVRVSRCGA